MKTYQATKSSAFTLSELNIPADDKNRHYKKMLAEVEAGEAQILPYVAVSEAFDFNLEISKLVKVFPDGRKVKSRPEDEVYIRVKMGHMAPLEVTTFGMGTYVGTFTREELQEVLDYGYAEVEKLVDIERTGGA